MDGSLVTEEERLETVRDRAREVLAPAMVEFVKWILRSAGERNIRRIYFLARDGWPMYRAARILGRDVEPAVDCRYFCCSRYALRIPCFHLMDKREIADQVCVGGVDVTLRKILKRGGLDEKEAERTAEVMGMREELDRVLPYREILRLRESLLEGELFWRYVYSHAAKAYDTAVYWIAQEGFLEPVRCAVADSGWTGSMQLTLKRLLESMNYRGKLEGFYYGLYHIPEQADPRDYHAYYFGPDGKIRRKVYFSNSLFECVFSQPEGMCVGYGRTKEGMAPVREKGRPENRALLTCVTEAVEEQAGEERKELAERTLDWHIQDPGTAQRKLARLMGSPTREEAEAFGGMAFSDDVLDADQTLAAPLSEEQIRENRFLARGLSMVGLRRDPVHESAWMEGSILLCGRHVRRHLWHNRLYKYALYYRKQMGERRKR